MLILNYTPHTMNILDVEGNVQNIPSSGCARVASTSTQVDMVGGFAVNRNIFGAVEGLPAPQNGVVYVVSTLVLNALNGTRDDVYAPGALIRDDGGNVIGAKGLSVV